MDDVIFGGTASRPARNIAEVALTHRQLRPHARPPPFNDADELEVTRRIEREAGLDLPHQRPRSSRPRRAAAVRRRRDRRAFARAGAPGPASARSSMPSPQTRRRILEEAAGISGLHSRRHEAELRLRAAESQSGAPRRRASRARKPADRPEEAGPPGESLSQSVRSHPPRRSAAAASAAGAMRGASIEAARDARSTPASARSPTAPRPLPRPPTSEAEAAPRLAAAAPSRGGSGRRAAAARSTPATSSMRRSAASAGAAAEADRAAGADSARDHRARGSTARPRPERAIERLDAERAPNARSRAAGERGSAALAESTRSGAEPLEAELADAERRNRRQAQSAPTTPAARIGATAQRARARRPRRREAEVEREIAALASQPTTIAVAEALRPIAEAARRGRAFAAEARSRSGAQAAVAGC